jgi:hypothetical protein
VGRSARAPRHRCGVDNDIGNDHRGVVELTELRAETRHHDIAGGRCGSQMLEIAGLDLASDDQPASEMILEWSAS